MLNIWIKLVGVWLLCDGLYSLIAWVGKPEQSWVKDHSIRIFRGVIGLVMVIWG